MYFLRLKRTPQISEIVGYSLIDLIDLIRLVTILKAFSAWATQKLKVTVGGK